MEDTTNQGKPAIAVDKATPNDAKVIREIQYRTWLATYPNEAAGVSVDDIEDRYKDSFTEEAIKKRELRIQNQPDNETTFVAKVNGVIVGFCSAGRYEAGNQLYALYVLPDFQGSGVGSSLWAAAVTFFDSTKDTYVEVGNYNMQAINFYKRLGFVETGKVRKDEPFRMKSGAVIPLVELVIRSPK